MTIHNSPNEFSVSFTPTPALEEKIKKFKLQEPLDWDKWKLCVNKQSKTPFLWLEYDSIPILYLDQFNGFQRFKVERNLFPKDEQGRILEIKND